MTLEDRDLKHIWHPCSQMKDYEKRPPIPIASAKGLYLYDVYGNAYMDVISSWWCNLLGHGHPQINAAITHQLSQLEHVIFANFTHEGAITLCEKLVKHLPPGLTKFHFSDNGSAAVECALKMAFQYHHQTGNLKKVKFMSLTDGYHGETLGALAVGAMDLYAKLYKPMLMETLQIQAPNCYRCPYGLNRNTCHCPCFEHMEKAFERHAHETAAIIIEPLLQGSAGMRIYPALYLRRLRTLCDTYDVLLIADEIATGFGRTGKWFACDHADISPDIICLSKGLTGGYLPMSLTVTTDAIYHAFYADYAEQKAFMHSHTYSGNPLACAAAGAVMDILDGTDVLLNAQHRAKSLTAQLKETFGSHPNVGEIRNIGLINAVELVADKENKTPFPSRKRLGYTLYLKALEEGLLLRPLGDVLYLNPPLTFSEENQMDLFAKLKRLFKT